MISILLIIILWSWGLTPVWVNVIGTILMFLRLSVYLIDLVVKVIKD